MRRHGTLRTLRRLAVLILVALLCNLAVAWILAAVRPFELDGWSESLARHTAVSWYYFPDDEGATAWVWAGGGGSVVDGRGVGWESRGLGFHGYRGTSEVRRIADDPPPALISFVPLPPQGTFLELVYCRAGFPLAAFEGAVVLDYDEDDAAASYPKIVTHGAVLAPIRPTRGSWPSTLSKAEVDVFSGHGVVLPLHPMIGGLVVNTAFYALLIAVPIAAVRGAVRSRRRRKGRCAFCGYPRVADRPCPECGAAG